MHAMFHSATSFNSDLSKWDVSSVTTTRFMFYSATSFTSDLSKWDVSSVTDMWGMFYSATSFNADLSKWDVSSVTDMRLIFYGATSFTGSISMWDMSSEVKVSQMLRAANGSLDESSMSATRHVIDGADSSAHMLGGMWHTSEVDFFIVLLLVYSLYVIDD